MRHVGDEGEKIAYKHPNISAIPRDCAALRSPRQVSTRARTSSQSGVSCSHGVTLGAKNELRGIPAVLARRKVTISKYSGARRHRNASDLLHAFAVCGGFNREELRELPEDSAVSPRPGDELEQERKEFGAGEELLEDSAVAPS
ncbi:hypothetical protein DFH09DRAFT_1101227 [Mycena vulgaris]|nr:hypothetical protein DFH09DRAFT_1101227 [Mycena vulgaris]